MKNMHFLFFILISFTFSSCEIKISELTFEDKDKVIAMSDLSNSEYYFKLSFADNSIIPNYLKIFVEQKELARDINSYIISYYGNDINFKNRTQTILSKCNLESKVYMWLNKNQIKNGFFFKVELQDKNVNILQFQINIMKYDYIELDTINFYNKYYITEENKNINYLIKGEKQFFKENDNTAIIIWADGNKEITANINAPNYVKHSNHNAFIIYNVKHYDEYIFSVNGTIGDFLDVGVIFLKNNKFYDPFKYSIEDILKIFLKKNILEEICFEDSENIKYLDDINIKIPFYSKGNGKCVKLPDELDELFFAIHLLWYFGYPLMSNSPIYYSLLTGINYYQHIPAKITIGYIPLTVDEDFNYLTYTIHTIYKNPPEDFKAEVYISNCNNYPSCTINENELKNSTS